MPVRRSARELDRCRARFIRSIGGRGKIGAPRCIRPRKPSRSPPREAPIPLTDTILVYRDRIVPRSEAHFLRRLYIGFERLKPIWVGRKTDDGLADLGARPLLLGRTGIPGALDRSLFKLRGTLPPVPDLRTLQPRLVHAHFGR